ncbi:hypothetical protein [Sphingobacterium sp. JUb56]|uniref:hypothetical protein n=1 Tax=Sphingobacterium sp. JUb56 TaxID=2587145 RepID=UPI001616303A|nr:hypothetical protein [Sphingobacterium sp. JUb56]MBB2951183.1 hypothetical protein [Sphingobacterium sp. JUb56]
MSRQFEDMQQEKRDRKIADQLGLTYEELCNTTFDIEENVGNDDYVYGYFIRFNENSPKEILNKIVELNNFCVDIDLNDEPEEDYFDSQDDGNELLTDGEQNIGEQLLYDLAEKAKIKRNQEK